MTLSIVGSDSFVTSTIAAIATGWSDPLPGGTASHWETVPLHGAQTFTSYPLPTTLAHTVAGHNSSKHLGLLVE